MKIYYDKHPNPYNTGRLLVDEEGRDQLKAALEKINKNKIEPLSNPEYLFNITSIELWDDKKFSAIEELDSLRHKEYKYEKLGCILAPIAALSIGTAIAQLIIYLIFRHANV